MIRRILIFIVMSLSLAHGQDLPQLTKKNVTLDSDFREMLKVIKTKCSGCQVYYNVGIMAGEKGEQIQAVFLLIRDYGTNFRVHRTKTQRGMDVITLYVPGQVVDLELIKFIKGGT